MSISIVPAGSLPEAVVALTLVATVAVKEQQLPTFHVVALEDNVTLVPALLIVTTALPEPPVKLLSPE